MDDLGGVDLMPESLVHNVDCLTFMKGLPDKAFELAIVDVPYGLGEGQKRVNQRGTATKKWPGARPPEYGGSEWDSNPPNEDYFYELARVSKNMIIWGANHFIDRIPLLMDSPCWVVWYKKRFDEVNDFADCELAWSSFDTACRLFHFPWIGFGAINAGEQRIHPTQKPVSLYKWLLKNYAKPGDRIFDSHMGSQSSRIAAYDMGFDFVGCELDKDYFDAGNKRFEQYKAQLKLF